MNIRQFGLASMLMMLGAAPVAAQGIPSGARIGGGRSATPLTRIMVATPYVFTTADSATAVSVGQAMRDRMERVAPRNAYSVISDSMMSSALVQFGYDPHQLLTPALARALAQQIAGRVLVTSQMSRPASGQWSMVARLAGTNDDAGVTVRIQQSGAPQAMGSAAADALKPALEHLANARECMNLRAQKPADAAKKAESVLKEMPGNGLAHYCLAQLANDTARKVEHLSAAIAGDSLSVIAMRQLASIHEVQGDTAQAVTMLQHMLRASPTDQELRQSAFRYFLSAGRSDAAVQVADEGLRLDPSNAELYDLKSSACLFSGNYQCAVQALEQAYAVDSLRADTLFFAKIAAAAEQRLSDTLPVPTAADTTTYAKWVAIGAQKFPSNPTMLANLIKGYTYTGQADSTLAAAKRLLAIDSTNVTAALSAAQALVNARRADEAMPYIEVVSRNGDDFTKPQAAGILTNGALKYIQPDTTVGDTANFEIAGNMLRKGVELAPDAPFSPTMSYLLAVANLQLTAQLDDRAVASKSCETARRMDTLMTEAGPAIQKAKTGRPDEAGRLEGSIVQYKERTTALVSSFCG